MADLTISVDIDATGTKRGTEEVKSAVKGIRQSIAGMDFAKLGQNLKYAGAIAQVVGQKLMQVGTALTIGVTTPIIALGTAIVKAGGEYEKALNIFQAVTKATGAEMDRAAQVAKDLGADLSLPATSAKDAALAMVELGKAGLTAAESMDAAKGVLQLAAAGQLDEARAAEIAANALNAFNLKANDTTRVANLLAAAANASSAEVNDIALAMQQAGSSFATAKMPIEDMVTAISALANAGIKGSDAGTSLKTFIQSLAAPSSRATDAMKELGISVFDTTGKMKQMPEIIGLFQTALAGLTDEKQAAALYKIFGSDAIRAAQILFRTGTEGFANLKEQVTAAGAAAELANARMKGLSGAWEGFKSQLETLGIEIYEVIKAPLTEFLQNLAAIVSRATTAFSQLSPEMQNAIIAFAAIAAALGPVLVVVGAVVSAIGTLIAAAGAISSAIAAVGGMAVAGPAVVAIILAIIAGIGQLGIVAGALYAIWTTNFGGIRDLTKIVADAVMQAWDALMAALSDLTSSVLAEVADFWAKNKDDILAIVQQFSDSFRALWTVIVEFWRENNTEIKAIASAVWEAIKTVIIAAVRIIGDVITLFLKVIRGDWAGAWEATKTLLADVTLAWISIVAAAEKGVVAAVKLVLSAVWALASWIIVESEQLGRNIGIGLIKGMANMTGEVVAAAKRLAEPVVDALRWVFKTQSPSKVTHEIGVHVAQGLADGLNDGTAEAVKAASSIGGKIIGGLQQIFGGDLGGFLQNALGVLTDSSRSWGDRLRTIFSGIARNFRAMVSDMLSSWLNSKLFGGSGSGSSGGGVGPGGTAPWNPGGSGSGGSIFSQVPGSTGSINSNGEYVVNGNQAAPFQFGNFSNMTNSIGTIAGIGTMVGGAIGGKAGNLISSVSGGALTGLMLGLKFGSIGGPLGAAIGAAAGFGMAILGGLFSSPKRKRDKNEKMPQLTKGFLDALTQLKALRDDKNAILSNPSGAMAKADELRAAIANGFGIQFESKKYSKIAQQQIAIKLAEADALVKQIKEFAEVSRAANERDRRLIPEFAGGVYMSPAFMAFRRRNGMLGGAFTGRDTIPAMLAHGEAVLNPRQMAAINRNAGFDVLKTANIPGYAAGGMAAISGTQTIQTGDVNVTVVVEQDAAGLWHATAQSSAGQKVIAKVVNNAYWNDEIKQKRRGG